MSYFLFNQYSSLLLIGVLQGLVFAALLWRRAGRWERPADRFAALLLVTLCLYVAQWMLGFANWYDAHNWQTTVMFYVPWANYLLIGPLVYFYFRALTNAAFRWQRRYWWHFVPFFVLLLEPLAVFGYDIVYLHWLRGAELSYFFHTRGPWAEAMNTGGITLYDIVTYLFVRIHLIGYLVLTILLYRRYRRYLLQNFASEDRYAFRWVRSLLIVFLAGISVALVTNILEQVFEFSYVGSWYSYFVLGATIYIISIQFFLADPAHLRNLRFNPDDAATEAGAVEPAAVTATDPELQHWGQRLAEHMTTARPYLDSDLSLRALAEQIGTNSSVLSRVVNIREGLNFNDYINGFRCREVIRRFEAGDHEHLTFLAMALDAGFNSKATFNRAFKKYTGKSPRVFVAALPARSDEGLG